MEIAAAERPVSELLKILFHIIIFIKKDLSQCFFNKGYKCRQQTELGRDYCILNKVNNREHHPLTRKIKSDYHDQLLIFLFFLFIFSWSDHGNAINS
jgi:hypothetical protein